VIRLGWILAAGGRGLRMGGPRPKQFLELAGEPVLLHALRTLPPLRAHGLAAVAVGHPSGEAGETRLLLERFAAETEGFGFDEQAAVRLVLVPGGATRQASVAAALMALPAELDLIAVHDAVRPLATPELVLRLLAALVADDEAWGVVPLLPPGDTLKSVSILGPGHWEITGTADRERTLAVQTPQLFRAARLSQAHERAVADGVEAGDDAALVERCAGRLLGLEGERANIKLTRPEDLDWAAAWLARGTKEGAMRVGQGFDVHAFCEGRPLMLGGVEIPCERGLAGHSDADVLLHAIADAVLGAAGLGDIGRHFPDTDAAYAGADSWELLREVAALARRAGWRVLNLDATVICERPKIAPHAQVMRTRIAAALGLPAAAINLKGTTSEGLGFTGRGEGIAAQAVCLLRAL
jgi:2-C-methyl-D-erythritol 2,4-cyclodiphosphate synthase/2-C-methyl-D-erythritol 4-phosphate cytidylyltransferase